MQILDLSHYNDPFVGFNSLAWGHFQCDVCVVFVFLAFLIPMKDDSFSMLLLILAFHVSHYRSQTEALFLSFAFIVVAAPKILLSKFSLKLSSQNQEEMKRKSFDTSSLVGNLE